MSQSIVGLWRDQAARYAEKTAAIIGPQEISYAMLDARSNQLALVLQRRGVNPGDHVAIASDRSAELLIAFLAVLKLGAVYVPLDMESPSDRLAFILQEAAVKVILAKTAFVSRLPSSPLPRVELDPDFTVLANIPRELPAIPIDPGCAACIMFTSGSTGRPKGIVVSQRSIVHLVRGQDYVPFGPELRMLVASAPSFDGITYEIWGGLLNGATCVVYQPAQMDLDTLGRTIRDGGATTCLFTPRLFNRIIDLDPSVIAPLKHIVLGGEALSPAHIHRALQVLPGVALINGYGPTECTTFACTYAIPANGRWPGDSVPIGFPLARIALAIVDKSLQPVAPGAIGELCLAGTGLALGYFNQPGLTAERFVTLSLPGTKPCCYYRTGDLCRLLPGGEVAFLGRRDGQVKLRGFRIELEEIESVLARHPAVREAAVVAVKGPDGSLQLAAFVVARDEVAPADGETLRSFLLQRLPAYMCPAHYRPLATLPLTLHGKLDRAELAARWETVTDARTEGRLPDTPLEHKLLDIWREALGDCTLRMDADFFVAGGDSLLGMQVIADIERTFARKLPIGALLEAPTVTAMAARLEGADFGRPRLQGFGPGVPLFYLPGFNGYALMPRAIARRLDGVCMYCDTLQFPDSRSGETVPPRMEDIAAAFVAQIRACDPRGRYNLAGYSFGGELAFETARQLRESGAEVPHVFLLDAMPKQNFRRLDWFDACWSATQFLVRGGAISRREFFRTRMAKLGRAVRTRIPGARHAAPKPPPADKPGVGSHLEASLWKAHLDFRPQPMDAHGVFLGCNVRDFSLRTDFGPDNGWGRFFQRGLDIHRFDCDHDQLIVEPHISRVAEIVLARAYSTAPTPRAAAAVPPRPEIIPQRAGG